MIERDEVNLTAAEQAVLTQLEASAAKDHRLVRKLGRGGPHRGLRLGRMSGGPPSPFWAIPLVVAGLATMVLSLSTILAAGWVGLFMTTAGLWHITTALRRRWFGQGQAVP
jgi:hypothetical protein